MPWKVQPVSEIRLAFVHHVRTLNHSVTDAAREFGIARKTGYKWLARFDDGDGSSLENRSRRPKRSPATTIDEIESQILRVRDEHGWGARKIHGVLKQQGIAVPSARTITNILKRCGRIKPGDPDPQPPLQRFERDAPHELWQCDFKGPLEIGRRKIHPFTVLDDHSRYLVALTPCVDLTHNTAFDVLWDAFGEFGLPESILCDNAFAADGPGICGFESRLLRLGINPIHGRPYHPQTQGKVERLHATLEKEVWPRVRRDSLDHFGVDITHWRRNVYNTLRPHESLGDLPPVSRLKPNPRKRPEKIPDPEYDDEATLRKVTTNGTIRWQQRHVLIGTGVAGETVMVEESDHELLVSYCRKVVRRIPLNQLVKGKIL